MSKELSIQRVETLRRQARVEDMCLIGTPPHQIAVALGVSRMTISRDLKDVYERWLSSTPRLREKRLLAIRGNEYILREAMLAWERSKRHAEEVSVVRTPRRCPDCKDGLVDGGRWCESCGGAGAADNEVTTTRVKGQAGDSAHLRVAFETRKEISRLWGFGDSGKFGRKGKEAEDAQRHIHLHVQGDVDWSQAPPDLLLRMKAFVDRALGKRPAMIEEGVDGRASGDSEESAGG